MNEECQYLPNKRMAQVDGTKPNMKENYQAKKLMKKVDAMIQCQITSQNIGLDGSVVGIFPLWSFKTP